MTDLALSITPPPGRGWIRLPVEPPKRKFFGSARGIEKPLTDWAAAQAREAFGPDADRETVVAYATLLTRLSISARERGEKMAFVWFPEPGGLPVAQISVSAFGPSDETATLDSLEEKLSWRDSQTGQLEVERMELAAGQAVRVRRVQATGDSTADDSADPSEVAVSIAYGFLPPQLDSALVFRMFWTLDDDEPVLTEIADSTAKTLRVA